MGVIRFRALLQRRGPAAAVVLDETQVAAALAADPQAAASFERMAFTHRKGYARWIAEAKRAEVRQRRVTQAVEIFRAGKTRS
jgi:uncharacterized protein YdeI (YjbR/CyaY-like superfamily)